MLWLLRDLLASPRVQMVGEDDQQAVYHVEDTGDAEYDYRHQEFVESFFPAGFTHGDFKRYSSEYGGEEIHDDIDCCHFTAKVPPTPTCVTASAVITRQAAPQTLHESRKTKDPVPAFHATVKALIECKRCQARYPSKTKLFKHLRESGHFTLTVHHTEPSQEEGLMGIHIR
ncbi:hypothetical protein FN846DRAFT_912798 [Sphaerosporella brunnea]|uniref:C2H2-type domain-containing protein n=1 Tax=Sphaerosporella brunnea TaxID=1250544 RepID=A0A5J5EIP0_9PEZI|nr:hypothetical protein FN846DRAFT_912798 [Sphaerosporella brunnea]